jgi:hypothetical protein
MTVTGQWIAYTLLYARLTIAHVKTSNPEQKDEQVNVVHNSEIDVHSFKAAREEPDSA